MDREFIIATADLARSAPREWATFLAEFAKFADGQTKLLLSATPHEFQRMQGAACAIGRMLEKFAAVREQAAKLKPH